MAHWLPLSRLDLLQARVIEGKYKNAHALGDGRMFFTERMVTDFETHEVITPRRQVGRPICLLSLYRDISRMH